VPGVKQEDLNIHWENHTLTVRGERAFEQEKNYHRVERRYGSFVRSFTLPNTVDSEKAKRITRRVC
jgi:HSP20 family protein